jgi:hypothetical protein
VILTFLRGREKAAQLMAANVICDKFIKDNFIILAILASGKK